MNYIGIMNKTDSPYYRGAKAGRMFGLYLSSIFLSMAMSSYFPLLSLVTIVLIVCIPLYIYRSLRNSYLAGGYSMVELWVQGIATFLFATAICGLVTIVYMKWIAPGFLVEQVRETIAVCHQAGTPEQLELARVLNNMIEQGVVPSPSTFVISMFWLTMAGGCFLSLIMASIARIGKPRSRRVSNANP